MSIMVEHQLSPESASSGSVHGSQESSSAVDIISSAICEGEWSVRQEADTASTSGWTSADLTSAVVVAAGVAAGVLP